MYIKDSNPMIGFRMAPNFRGAVNTAAFEYNISINSHGYRDSEWNFENNKKLIGVFGDSFAFGQGVESEDNFSSKLRSILMEHDYEILNAGVCSYSPSQEMIVYKELVEKYNFNTIVIQLCFNDIRLTDRPPDEEIYEGRLYYSKPENFIAKIKAFLVSNSEILSHLQQSIWQLSNSQKDLKIPYFVKADYHDVKYAEIQSTLNLLIDWINDAKSKDIDVIIIYIPNRICVETKWEEQLSSWQNRGSDIDLSVDSSWLSQIKEIHPDIKLEILTDDFKYHITTTNDEVYFKLNGHINEIGHTIVARRLADIILSTRSLTSIH